MHTVRCWMHNIWDSAASNLQQKLIPLKLYSSSRWRTSWPKISSRCHPHVCPQPMGGQNICCFRKIMKKSLELKRLCENSLQWIMMNYVWEAWTLMTLWVLWSKLLRTWPLVVIVPKQYWITLQKYIWIYINMHTYIAKSKRMWFLPWHCVQNWNQAENADPFVPMVRHSLGISKIQCAVLLCLGCPPVLCLDKQVISFDLLDFLPYLSN